MTELDSMSDLEAPEDAPLLPAERAAVRTMLQRQQDGGNVESTVKRLFARFGSAPANWHQATVFFLSSENDASGMRKKAPIMFLGGLLIILFQIAAVMGVAGGAPGSRRARRRINALAAMLARRERTLLVLRRQGHLRALRPVRC